MIDKCLRLIRLHRQHVFDPDDVVADHHARALHRLQQTRTYREYCQRGREMAAHHASERLLAMWA